MHTHKGPSLQEIFSQSVENIPLYIMSTHSGDTINEIKLIYLEFGVYLNDLSVTRALSQFG